MTVKQMTYTALGAVLIAVTAPLSLPVGDVPVSLATLSVMLTAALLKEKAGCMSTLIYLLLGLIGLPVFAGWTSGAGILFGMTGGYLFGYLILAWCTGKAAGGDRWKLASGMVFGTVLLYTAGTIWFVLYTKMQIIPALAVCVFPFLPGDALKILIVTLLVKRLPHKML